MSKQKWEWERKVCHPKGADDLKEILEAHRKAGWAVEVESMQGRGADIWTPVVFKRRVVEDE